MTLDRTTTTLMKGYGILFIALHNFLHKGSLTGFIKENENTYDVQRTWDYFDVLRTFEWSNFGQFFSFLGWIGVPVFLFISGYGLVKKYENSRETFMGGQYVFHSWKKLFMLLLPAAIYAILLSLVVGNWKTVIPMKVLQLTMLNNLLVPMVKFSPGEYWYFSITFELYLLYLLVRHWNVKQLLILLVGIIIIQAFTVIIGGADSDVWSWVRHNFTGWGQIFLTGVIVAKTNIEKYIPQKPMVQLLLAVACLVSLPIFLLNKWAWLLLVPFVALLFFIFLICVVSKTKVLKAVGLWLGTYSSFIFVVHPIARELMIILNKHMELSLCLLTFAYVALFVMGAIVYKPIYTLLMNLKVSNSCKLK